MYEEKASEGKRFFPQNFQGFRSNPIFTPTKTKSYLQATLMPLPLYSLGTRGKGMGEIAIKTLGQNFISHLILLLHKWT